MYKIIYRERGAKKAKTFLFEPVHKYDRKDMRKEDAYAVALFVKSLGDGQEYLWGGWSDTENVVQN